ncbi:hypothetical protein GOV08_04185 [Candidatus Woesearchaeota archaeon]|nr:hypothetical protein [Candidatus Woesearchaeota archaeon]
MQSISPDFLSKYSIRVIGDYDKLNSFEKYYLNDRLYGFLEQSADRCSEGVLTADIRLKKGVHNRGVYRGVPLVYIKLRISSDRCKFAVSKENWGLQAALHDSLSLMTKKIRNAGKQQNNKRTVPIENFDMKDVSLEI